MKIGLISDTHGYLHPRLLHYLSGCSEIWHAGDWGSYDLVQQLGHQKMIRSVYGNIDGQTIRSQYNEMIYFELEHVKVCMMHIGGYPGRYDKRAFAFAKKHNPQIFVCGHSHILKVQFDNNNQWLYLNPGATGNHGWHKVITMITFDLLDGKILNMQVIELGPRGKISD